MPASILSAGETLRRIAPDQNLILDTTGAIVGIQNKHSTGADFRGSGPLQYVDVTASRTLLSSDIGKIIRNTGASAVTITLAANLGSTGQFFATQFISTGTITVATGGGVTAVDAGGYVAAQVSKGTPVVWTFASATEVQGG